MAASQLIVQVVGAAVLFVGLAFLRYRVGGGALTINVRAAEVSTPGLGVIVIGALLVVAPLFAGDGAGTAPLSASPTASATAPTGATSSATPPEATSPASPTPTAAPTATATPGPTVISLPVFLDEQLFTPPDEQLVFFEGPEGSPPPVVIARPLFCDDAAQFSWEELSQPDFPPRFVALEGDGPGRIAYPPDPSLKIAITTGFRSEISVRGQLFNPSVAATGSFPVVDVGVDVVSYRPFTAPVCLVLVDVTGLRDPTDVLPLAGKLIWRAEVPAEADTAGGTQVTPDGTYVIEPQETVDFQASFRFVEAGVYRLRTAVRIRHGPDDPEWIFGSTWPLNVVVFGMPFSSMPYIAQPDG
jgi:hypothetical protein